MKEYSFGTPCGHILKQPHGWSTWGGPQVESTGGTPRGETGGTLGGTLFGTS